MFKSTISNGNIFVQLPKYLSFDYDFLYSVSRLIKLVLTYKELDKLERLTVRCDANITYDKMCKAYLCNVLSYLKSKEIIIYINQSFKNKVMGVVRVQPGEKYQSEIDITKIITSNNLKYYCFDNDKDIYQPVNNIVDMISSLSLTINDNELRDFLTTTIGEIFSNSYNHSEQNEVFFMSDVVNEKDEFYLYVNIIDYGTTIIHNVKRFLQSNSISGKCCMEWAVKRGNTTREGSGGYGLDTLIKYISAVKGILMIFSGNANYLLTNKGEIFIRDTNDELFCGTSVTFKVKLFDSENIVTYKNEVIESISLEKLFRR